MRSTVTWQVAGVVLLAGCVAAVVTVYRQFQQQIADMRQEIHRLEGRNAPLDADSVPIDPNLAEPSRAVYSDTRLLRQIFLDDLREQLAGEESEEVASRIMKSWFE
jgi:hypothetical protein